MSGGDAIAKFPFPTWKSTRRFLPRVKTITGVSYINEGPERVEPWAEVVITLDPGSSHQATYECQIENHLKGLRNNPEIPQLDRQLPDGTIVTQRLSEFLCRDRAMGERKLRRAHPIPPLSRARLISKNTLDPMTDADLTGCMRTLNKWHQEANGTRIHGVSLVLDDRDELPFDFIGTLSGLQPFGPYEQNIHRGATSWSGSGTRNVSMIVANKALVPSLTECLTSQALFNQAQGLETLRLSVNDAANGVPLLSKYASIRYPSSLRSIILDLSLDDLNLSKGSNSPAALSKYIRRCDPNGAVRMDINCTEFKESTSLRDYRKALDRCETARTGRQRGSDPFAVVV